MSGDTEALALNRDSDEDFPFNNSLEEGFVWLVFILMLIFSTIIHYIKKTINFIKNYINIFISKYIRKKKSND